jgi:hypothetical protein
MFLKLPRLMIATAFLKKTSTLNGLSKVFKYLKDVIKALRKLATDNEQQF